MKFSLVDEIPYPRERVFRTHRDSLLDLVSYLPNVEGVDITSREVDGDVVRLVNHWTGASSDVPRMLRPIIKPELLTWIDRASWDQGRWRCDWQITLNAIPEAVTARGYNVFLDEDDETVIQMQATQATPQQGQQVQAPNLPPAPDLPPRRPRLGRESLELRRPRPHGRLAGGELPAPDLPGGLHRPHPSGAPGAWR